MTGYKIVNLKLMVEEIGEEKAKNLLSDFACPLNEDVERFLREKAIEFAKQGLAQTHVVYASFRGEPAIAGYFTLADKYITVKSDAVKGKLKQRIKRFSILDTRTKNYCLTAPLIAQLGKNYAYATANLITGDELLKIACRKVAAIQLDLGGKFVYLECEDKAKLLDFYESNGFCYFDRRTLDQDEIGLTGKYLVQMIKYIK